MINAPSTTLAYVYSLNDGHISRSELMKRAQLRLDEVSIAKQKISYVK